MYALEGVQGMYWRKCRVCGTGNALEGVQGMRWRVYVEGGNRDGVQDKCLSVGGGGTGYVFEH